MESEQMDTSSKFSLEPDSLSDFETTEIVMDTEKDVPYDIVMTVVDLNYGAYGIFIALPIKCKNVKYISASFHPSNYINLSSAIPLVLCTSIDHQAKCYCSSYSHMPNNLLRYWPVSEDTFQYSTRSC
ncbi:hypothetical protein CEXT_447291 [Caerostris extrusa]|uniref:Uncharacterized protein n=1 Tax=Caerostris extrusa TaxID=172846 RepID=A0AAV4VT47_CAEEX|nr:hypothetical protein CEXT_447291 [Caerostris extrusa]